MIPPKKPPKKEEEEDCWEGVRREADDMMEWGEAWVGWSLAVSLSARLVER